MCRHLHSARVASSVKTTNVGIFYCITEDPAFNASFLTEERQWALIGKHFQNSSDDSKSMSQI